MTDPAPTHLPTKDLFRLDCRTIIITGGNGAVGLTIGKSILESGGDIVCLDLPDNPSMETWKSIEDIAALNGTKASYYKLDCTVANMVTTVFDKIRPGLRFPIRGLVACAGISGESDAAEYPIDIFRQIVDVNVAGTFLAAQAVGKEIHRANIPGSIVIIASMSGHISNKGINTSAYNASKAALHQLARSLAAESGHPQNTFPGSTTSSTNPNPSSSPRKSYPPIRVNTLSPGHIETPISEAARLRGLTVEWSKQNMLGRISQVEEFRAPILFLLADSSSYMTGADLRVDGGHCAW